MPAITRPHQEIRCPGQEANGVKRRPGNCSQRETVNKFSSSNISCTGIKCVRFRNCGLSSRSRTLVWACSSNPILGSTLGCESEHGVPSSTVGLVSTTSTCASGNASSTTSRHRRNETAVTSTEGSCARVTLACTDSARWSQSSSTREESSKCSMAKECESLERVVATIDSAQSPAVASRVTAGEFLPTRWQTDERSGPAANPHHCCLICILTSCGVEGLAQSCMCHSMCTAVSRSSQLFISASASKSHSHPSQSMATTTRSGRN
mmetsp:Transcript_102072/g.233812  ORF Transcript_102072/g.233812 Transcript_102072/m.233812 type:complete len:265 (-) Transcript_102072:1377-2171(-)